MTEERIREIAQTHSFGILPVDGSIEDAIRLALAERDREVRDWASAHADMIPAEDPLERGVELGPLLRFLEAQP